MAQLGAMIKVFLRVSVQILSGILLFFLYMFLQKSLNGLPYNLALLGPLCLVLMLVWLKRRSLGQVYSLSYAWRRTVKIAAVTLISMLVWVAFFMLLWLLLDYESVEEGWARLLPFILHPVKHLPTLLNILIAAGLEEVLCRFFILALLMHNGLNRYWAMLISAVLFSLCHGQYNMFVWYYILIIGIALAMLYLMYRNLGAAISLHFAINFLSYIGSDPNDNSVYAPQSFAAVFSDNLYISYACALVLLMWIYKMYVGPRLQEKNV